jgi:hypothetical protein
MPFHPPGWRPTTIERFIGSRPTGASVVIVDTDCGEGYLKGLGNESGPHALACELVGSLAADWIGLPTLDFGIIEVDEVDELPLAKGGFVQPGPAFISRRALGFSWGGDSETLDRLKNRSDLTKLVIFDTWVRNCDRRSEYGGRIRQNRDNVFIVRSDAGADLSVTAMDHTHAFTCGRDLTIRISTIDAVQDQSRYGLFPEFEVHWDLASAGDTLKRLSSLERETARTFVDCVPPSWEVGPAIREAWLEFLVARAHWLGLRNGADWMSG